MNYLAHLYLAGNHPDLILGSFIGDFIKGSSLDGYGEEVRRGIRLHRLVDAYTDSHPVVRESKERVAPARRRYAGIGVDVFYDHFLALHWAEYAGDPLPVFTSRVYALLAEREAGLPEGVVRTVRRMAAEDWLTSYADRGSVEGVLRRISRRLKRESGLAETVDDFHARYEEFRMDFHRFFPDLAGYAAGLRGE